MFKYFFIKSFISFLKQKPFFYIHLLGFSIGIACTLLLILFVQDELRYDRFHTQYHNIYRLVGKLVNRNVEASINSPLLLPLLQQDIPEIESSVQLLNRKEIVLSINDNPFTAQGIFTTPEFFDVFSFEISSGNPGKSLNEPNQIFLSEDLAIKYFGSTDVIGKMIKFQNELDLIAAGVFPTVPRHSHLQFSFIISHSTIYQEREATWGNSGDNIYLIPNNGTDIKALSEKIRELRNANIPDNIFDVEYRLQPLSKIYLNSTNISWDEIEKGDIKTVIGFSLMAVLILFISVFNYINLKIAQYFQKSRNIGIRKTLGAGTLQLSIQFYAETLIYTFFTLIIAVIIAECIMPLFNAITGKNFNLVYAGVNSVLPILVIIFIIIFLIVAVFPALYLSKFKPLMSMNRFYQEPTISGKTNRLFQTGKIFVFAQFIISILFAVSSITIYRQMKFITEEKIGYNKEHVIRINNPWDDDYIQRYELLKDKLNSISYIKSVSAARNVPTQQINSHTMAYLPENKENRIHIGIINIDFGYFDLLETKVLQGRNFNSGIQSDRNSSCIINKKLADELGIVKVEDHPIIRLYGDNKYQLIGVVDDMQYTSLREPIKPTAYTVQDWGLINILVKIQGGYILDFKKDVDKAWKEVTKKWPFEFQFLDENVDRIYQSETRALRLFSIFTIIAIFLSCLGIYGLAAYSVNKRIKEIGIRKVFGAHTFEILRMLSWSYIVIVGISFLIGSPLALILMNNWLKNFVFRIDLNWWTFAVPGSLVLLISLMAISWQTVKASLTNPIYSLRHE